MQIEGTLLPNSPILNIRQKRATELHVSENSKSKKTIESGEILIHDEALPFRGVDGRHRVRKLTETYKEPKENQSGDFEQIIS